MCSMVLAALLAPASDVSAAPGWFNKDWKYRRKISVSLTAAKWKDAPAVSTKFLCAGALLPEGRDLRATDASGKLVKSSVIGVGPGDEVLCVIEAVPNCEEYYVYYGNPNAPAPEAFDPKRGLLLETRLRGSGDPNSWADMQRILKGSTHVFGRDYWPKVFDGYNPFGFNENFVSIYSGWLYAPLDGKYTFCTASDDASFEFIDGKMVCSWPGWHGAWDGLFGQYSGTADLTKGYHKFEYYHVQSTASTTCVAGWKQPGQEKENVALIPDWAFPGLIEGRAQPQEMFNAPISVDFTPFTSADLMSDEFAFQMTQFYPFVSSQQKISSFKWDFGDGSVSREKNPTHVYLTWGVYPVTLTVTDSAGTSASVTNKVQTIYVFKPNETSYLLEEQVKKFAPYMKDYDLQALKADHLAALWTFFEQTSETESLRRVAPVLLGKIRGVAAANLDSIAERLGDFLSKDMGNFEGALQAFAALRAMDAPASKAKGLIKSGDVYLFFLKEPEKAREFYTQVFGVMGRSQSSETRFATIRLGDVSKYMGNFDDAQQQYAKAEAMLLPNRTGKQVLSLRGAYAQTTESYIKGKRFEDASKEIDMWEWEFPLEKLDGYTSWLRAQAHAGLNKPDLAIGECDSLIKVNPRSNYADKLLLIAADAYQKKGDKAGAIASLRKVVADYPASPLVPEAKSRLAKLEGK